VFGYNSLPRSGVSHKGIQREKKKLVIIASKKRTQNTIFIKQHSQQLLNIQ
jgi:hypothetical protein